MKWPGRQMDLAQIGMTIVAMVLLAALLLSFATGLVAGCFVRGN